MDYQTAQNHSRTCPRCGAPSTCVVVPDPTGTHFAKATCSGCGAFLDWIRKPDADKTRRPAAHRDLVQRFSRGYCELCLRGWLQVHLVGHHVIPFQQDGEPSRENVWILCDFCHGLVELIRKHVGFDLVRSENTAVDEPVDGSSDDPFAFLEASA